MVRQDSTVDGLRRRLDGLYRARGVTLRRIEAARDILDAAKHCQRTLEDGRETLNREIRAARKLIDRQYATGKRAPRNDKAARKRKRLVLKYDEVTSIREELDRLTEDIQRLIARIKAEERALWYYSSLYYDTRHALLEAIASKMDEVSHEARYELLVAAAIPMVYVENPASVWHYEEAFRRDRSRRIHFFYGGKVMPDGDGHAHHILIVGEEEPILSYARSLDRSEYRYEPPPLEPAGTSAV